MVDSIDESLFKSQSSYAQKLAHNMNHMSAPGELKLKYTKGDNTAYAYIDPEDGTLFDIVSTGGGAGTDLLIKIMQNQQSRGHGMNWIAETKSAQKYYDNKLGLSKYGVGKEDRYYNIPAADMAEVIKKLKK